ncbi:MAG: TIGR01244 family sulfur transferase, partial [Amphiplicatus sp.]
MPAKLRPLTNKLFVSAQITEEDIAAARSAGVALIINNRPEAEEVGQPKGADIEAAARAAGLDYVAIPIRMNAIGEKEVDAFEAAIGRAAGPVLAYCKSGTRSAVLTALVRARAGGAVDEILSESRRPGDHH